MTCPKEGVNKELCFHQSSLQTMARFLLAALLAACVGAAPVLESMGSILQQAAPVIAPDMAFTEGAREVTALCS